MGRWKTPHAILLAFLLTAGSLPFDLQARMIDRIVAIVNGEIIMDSELQEAVRQSGLGLLGPSLNQDIPQKFFLERNILSQMINKRIQLQLAKKLGITVSPEDIEGAIKDIKRRNGIRSDRALEAVLEKERSSLAEYTKILEDQIRILKLINREVRSAIVLGDKEIQSYHDKHPERFLASPVYHLRQIILPVMNDQDAAAVMQTGRDLTVRIKNGEDFKKLEKRYSSGANAKNGGDLGYIKSTQIHPQILKAVEHLAPGEISDPVQTSAGIHVFQLVAMKPPHNRSLEEVREEVLTALFRERSEQYYTQWLKDLRAMAQVEIKF